MNATQTSPIFVITIDGPTASGKGTIAQIVANRLGFHYLDSGALYRLVAFSVLQQEVALDDEKTIATIAKTLPCQFKEGEIFLKNENVTDKIREEKVGLTASKVATLPSVRQALLDLQKSFKREPGLVTDGRDMGTAIFPEATLKIFLTASVEIRAQRRYKQLIEKGFSAKLDDLRLDLSERDRRDTERTISPLAPASDAMTLDTTQLTIEEVVSQVLLWFKAKV